tara:strand:- start:2188 stop:4293 length:2106 start_codon:yes stop_codon:yes gene_type:complete
MKWIGQHIWDFISRFRSTVYIENLETSSEENVLVVDSDGKVTKNTTLGGSDVTMTNGADNRVMTATGATAITGETQFTYDASTQLTTLASSTEGFPELKLQTDNGDTNGPTVKFERIATNADNDILGNIIWKGTDDGGNSSQYATIKGIVADASNTDEAGKLSIEVQTNSTESRQALTATGLGTASKVDIGLGYGVASVTTLAGDLTINGDNITLEDDMTITSTASWLKLVHRGVEIENTSGSGATALLIDNDDADQIALDIDAVNTTGNIIDIAAPSLTTGKLINFVGTLGGINNTGLIDLELTNSGTVDSSCYPLIIDYNKTGNLASGQGTDFTGLTIDYDDTGTNDAAAATNVKGVDINLNNSSDQGNIEHTGINIDISGGDAARTNGIIIDTPNDANDILIRSAGTVNDYFSIDVKDDGETTFKTNEAGGSTAHINILADGGINITPTSDSVTIKQGGAGFGTGDIKINTNDDQTFAQFGAESGENSQFRMFEAGGDSANDYFNILVGEHGATTISTEDSNLGTQADLTIHADGEFNLTSSEQKINKIYDFDTTTFETHYTAGDQYSGTIMRYSPGANDTLNGSEIYYLHTDGTWNQAQSDTVLTGASQLLGVGLAGSARTVGVLLEGFIRVASTEIEGTPVVGAPVYISDTTAGHFDFNAPTDEDEYVRIVGYCIDTHSSDALIYFKPDNTWVEIA